MRYILFLVIICLLGLGNLKAQDATFSQYYNSALYLNPAFSGVESRLTLTGNSRTQWKSIGSDPYFTNQLSLIVPINTKGVKSKHLGGIGGSVYNFKAGTGGFQALGANLNFGYNLKLSSLNYITFGLQGGFVQRKIKTQDLQYGSQFDPSIGDFNPALTTNVPSASLIKGSTSFADFAAGVMYYYNPERDYEEKGFSFYLGGAAYHLTQPNESFIKDGSAKLPMIIKSHAGLEVNVTKRFNISPNILYANQNGLNQINTGLYLTFLFGDKEAKAAPSFLLLGTWYRLKDSYIFSAGLGNSVYTLGFSYDLNNSSLRYNTNGKGAYEISLKLQKPGSNKKVRIYNPLL